jgi:membrane-anchored protein YejM (alkaline phosphatase superfamily)
MKSLGEIQKVHSFSCFTPSSIIGFFLNFTPIGLNKGRLYPYKKWSWLPTELKKDGYHTALLTSNPIISMLDLSLNGIFQSSFDIIKTDYDGKTTVQSIVNDALSIIRDDDRFFLFLLLMETHTPIYNGEKSKIPFPIQRPSSVFDFQKGAIEYIDKNLEPLFDSLRTGDKTTDIIITSDHGELFGPFS